MPKSRVYKKSVSKRYSIFKPTEYVTYQHFCGQSEATYHFLPLSQEDKTNNNVIMFDLTTDYVKI